MASTGSSLEIMDIGAKKYSGVLRQKAPLNSIYCWASRIVRAHVYDENGCLTKRCLGP